MTKVEVISPNIPDKLKDEAMIRYYSLFSDIVKKRGLQLDYNQKKLEIKTSSLNVLGVSLRKSRLVATVGSLPPCAEQSDLSNIPYKGRYEGLEISALDPKYSSKIKEIATMLSGISNSETRLSS